MVGDLIWPSMALRSRDNRDPRYASIRFSRVHIRPCSIRFSVCPRTIGDEKSGNGTFETRDDIIIVDGDAFIRCKCVRLERFGEIA